ncbi:MAG: selenocysteine-specific translation elongation factor [Dehalococcoidia bacterium]|nr:selenocysteine-specific translation elongation factor [Dehalococcoidia bacterium]
MYVVGTSGHVDHGKSVLVRALTGIDPDRLPEEKVRGMTIDLGFAWVKLPSGRDVSIVDVPGHERFIKNMLAGVGGIDLALLIVAADEGVMPQTREHLNILDLLHVASGIVVVTKMDLVDADWLELVKSDIEEVLKGTVLEKAPMLPVSAITGEGIQELKSSIDQMLDNVPPKRNIGRPRLPIDRVFTIPGFGTVVTGTLIDGELVLGQEVELAPGDLKARVRGLQTHKQKIDRAEPGNRVAANLSGVSTGQLTRGMVVTSNGWLKPTVSLDVRLRLLKSAGRPLKHNAEVSFHTGAAESEAKIRLLDKKELDPGQVAWAQVVLTDPVAVVRGDLFVVRSTNDTLGGGQVVDPHARRHRRFHPPTIEALAAREKGAPEEVILNTLDAKGALDLHALTVEANLPQAEVKKLVESLLRGSQATMLGDKFATALFFSPEGWKRFNSRVVDIVKSHFEQFPLRAGMPKEALRTRLKMAQQPFSAALPRLLKEGTLIEDGLSVRLPGREVHLTRAQQEAIDRYLASLKNNPFSPSSDMEPDAELLNLLVESKQVVKVSDNVVFDELAYEEMVRRISDHIKSKGKVGLADVKDMFNTSRKYAVSLLEYLDRQGVTQRVGDDRVLKGGAAQQAGQPRIAGR